MKIDRKKIHQKFGGRCAYCGTVLKDETGKHMHVDHLEAIERNVPKSKWKAHWGEYRPCEKPENDNEANSIPSCPKCNILKNSLPIESFRNMIKDTIRQLERSTTYQRAVRFGMIEIKEWDGLFYFEKLTKTITMKKIIPFSNATEAEWWLNYNCDVCRRSNCSAKLAIQKGFISGYITERMAEFIGHTNNTLGKNCSKFTTVRISPVKKNKPELTPKMF
jgi:5-methylcytosine-specific restriction endonuclease McrA